MVRLFFVLMCLPLAAQFNEMEGEYRVDQPVKKVLFLGNSYTYYHTLPRVLGKLAAQAEPATPMTLRWHTIPGATLEQLSSNPKVHHWLQQDWDLVVLVLLDENYEPIELHEASHEVIANAMAEGDSKRSKRGAMSVAKFKIIGELAWSREDTDASASA